MEPFYWWCFTCVALFDEPPQSPRCELCGGRIAIITRELIEDTGFTPEQLLAATSEAR